MLIPSVYFNRILWPCPKRCYRWRNWGPERGRVLPRTELLSQESSNFGLSECDHICTSETVSVLSILLHWVFLSTLLPKLPFLTYCCSVMFQYPVNKSVIRLLHFHINLRMICFCFHKNAQTRTAVVFIHIAWNL